MATTISLTSVVAGDTVIDSDVNVNFATIEGFLNALDGENIQTNTIPGDRLKSNSIQGTKLVDAAVTAAKLATNSVTSDKILAANVTTAKIADLAVTSAKLAAGALTFDKMASGVCKIDIGTYAGNGLATQAITGVGFQPIVVLIASFAGSYAHTVLKTGDMTGTDAVDVTDGGAAITTSIHSLDADGFTVGTYDYVNALARTYYYIALGTT